MDRGAGTPAREPRTASLPPEPGGSAVEAAPTARPWHGLPIEAVVRELGSEDPGGLDSEEVARRRQRFGPNRLREEPPPSPWKLLFEHLRGGLVAVLVFAAALAAATGATKDAIVILVVVVLNAILGMVQELRAGRAMRALRTMLAPTCRVRRGAELAQVPASELVPGDRISLEAGDRVPADARLIAAEALEVDESSLTGETLPVRKRATPVLPEDTPLADRINCLFLNTVVTRGRGEAVVTATGMATEMGKIAALLQEEEPPPTPLQRDLGRLGHRLAAVAIAVIALLFGLEFLRGTPIAEIALTSIALAVAAIPEGLPAVVTVTLALGMWRMARSRAIVRRLASVETLGCTTVICTDKTGTLTENRMRVEAVVEGDRLLDAHALRRGGRAGAPVEGAGLPAVLRALVLCNDAEEGGFGDPTETALLDFAREAGVDRAALAAHHPRVAEIPFDSDARLMATFHLDGDRILVLVKGAPLAVLPRCSRVGDGAGTRPLDPELRERLARRDAELAGRALRVLAVASRELPAAGFDPAGDLGHHLEGLVFHGFVGLRDPPRPSARGAIRLCRRAGIEVKMVTGDHPITARAIARELGLEGEVATGAELEGLEGESRERLVARATVFARVAPQQKVEIVRVLRAQGHVVAVTGDGVNDAAALRTADIGVAMGRSGTEVAKQAADMVLADDDFSTIVRAVEEGRAIYDNIGKFVRFQLSTNFGAVLSVAGAPVLGLPLPFDPIQLLWVNIIMDGPPAMALGVDPPRPTLMEVPPRRLGTPMLPVRRLLRLLLLGCVMAVGTLGVLAWCLEDHGFEHARTLAFTTFVAFQLVNVLNVRSERATALSGYSFRNPSLWAAVLLAALLQVLATNFGPAQAVFETVELSWRDGLVALGVAASILGVEELRKLFARARGTTGGLAP